MSKFKSGDYVVPSSQIVIYDAKMKNYLGRVLQVATVHEKEYYGSVQAGIPGEEALGWNPHDLRLATAEEIAAAQKLKPLRRGDLVEYDGRVCVVAEIRELKKQRDELLKALRVALNALEEISIEMTVGDRFTNAGQYMLDALPIARDAIAKAGGAV